MKRPLIGLTGGRVKGREIASNLSVLDDSDIDIFFVDYSRAVLAAGAIPVWLPLDLDPADAVDSIDGLLVTGGYDVAPTHYGAEAAAETVAAPALRDGFELALLDEVARTGRPTLGICRGLQIINVHAGGTLHQHVPAHACTNEPGATEQHRVSLAADSVLAGLYGDAKAVNSLHHQSVDQVGSNLQVTATSDDGGVEGLEHDDLPIVAVQWHPEMMTTSATDPIFGWLLETASR